MTLYCFLVSIFRHIHLSALFQPRDVVLKAFMIYEYVLLLKFNPVCKLKLQSHIWFGLSLLPVLNTLLKRSNGRHRPLSHAPSTLLNLMPLPDKDQQTGREWGQMSLCDRHSTVELIPWETLLLHLRQACWQVTLVLILASRFSAMILMCGSTWPS